MKQIFATFSFVVCIIVSGYAQNYQCFQHNNNLYWYINQTNYLRCIRVDSFGISGSDTIYYPLPQYRYYSCTNTFDTLGASWLGKTVTEHHDGTFLFGNTYNDTVVIQTQAHLGDSWVFYNDSGSKYYIAKVIASDTMSVLGTLDSVKSIKINAYGPTGPDMTDFVNNFIIILSKNHGFAQIFDLYNFPYRSPFSTTVNNCDLYFNYVTTPTSLSSALNQIFNIIPFQQPTQLNMFRFQQNDVFDIQISTYLLCGCGPTYDYEGYEYDSVLSRLDIDSAHSTVALFKAFYQYEYGCDVPYSDRNYSYWTTIDTLYLTDAPVTRLPEQYAHELYPNSRQLAYYYYSQDTSYCSPGGLLKYTEMFVFEDCDNTVYRKFGLGTVDSDFCQQQSCPSATGVAATTYRQMVYNRIGGVSCGTYVPPYPVGVNDPVINSSHLIIYPNPATTELTISSPYDITALSITNLLGQTVHTGNYGSRQVQINIADLPTGIYFVKVNGSEARKFVKE